MSRPASKRGNEAAGPRGASVVVTSLAPDGRRFLLLRPSAADPDESGWAWVLPGGRRAPGEDIAACAARELREETGLAGQLRPVHAGRVPWAVFWLDVTWPARIELSCEHAGYEWVCLAEAHQRCPAAELASALQIAATAIEQSGRPGWR